MGALGPVSIRRSYLRKPSHRPVYILPNARREVSSGLRCPALRPFCMDTRGGELGQSAWNQGRSGNLVTYYRMPCVALVYSGLLSG